MAKIGLMGGTFDPIHIGHLIAAATAYEGANLDEVWFVPSASPPLKPNAPIASESERYEMVRLAIKDDQRFKACDVELNRGGTSYSIDTVAILSSRYPMHQFYYIVGSDRMMDLPQWHRANELIEQVYFIGLNRYSSTLSLEHLPEGWGKRIILCTMPVVDISSTEIRKRAFHQKSIRYYVTAEVEQYIRRLSLYG